MSPLPDASLEPVVPHHLRAVVQEIDVVTGGTLVLPDDLVAKVRARLLQGRIPKRWTRRQVQTFPVLLFEAPLTRTVWPLVWTYRTRYATRTVLAMYAQGGVAEALLPELFRRLEAGETATGPRWWQVQTRRSVRSRDGLLVRAVDELGDCNRIGVFLERAQFTVDTPLGVSAVRVFATQRGGTRLIKRAPSNLRWCVSQLDVPAMRDLARALFDAMLLRVDEATARDGLMLLQDAYGAWPDHGPLSARERWRLHEDQVVELARRLRIRVEVEGFFSKLTAAPDRLAFWRDQIPRISEVQGFKRVSGFAMRIGPHVFVEFGEVGNALFVYDAQDWDRRNIRPAAVNVPDDLKNIVPVVERFVHRRGWTHKVNAFIDQHT